MAASGHSDLPGGQGNAYADGVTGSGQLTATGIDPRIKTGLSVNESFHAATSHGVSGYEKRATGTMTVVDALDLLTVNGKRRESENDCDVHGSYSSVTELSYPSSVPRSEDREPREDSTRGRDSEVSLDSSRRRACGEEWGETTEAAAREGGVCCEQAGPASPAPEGEGEAGAHPRAPDESPETLPTTLAGPRSSGRGGSPHEGREEEEEEEEVPGRETPEGENALVEVSGAGGTEPEGREGFL